MSDDKCCHLPNPSSGGFQVEAVLSVDERGQMVLPKELRTRAGIKPGDKLTLVSWEKDGQICCMSLLKTDVFADMVKDFLGPMMAEVQS